MRYDLDRRVLVVAEGKLIPGTFTSNDHRDFPVRQFRAHYETGVEFSIIWGYGTYSANRNVRLGGEPFNEDPDTVEIAVITPEKWVEWRGDTVLGWVGPEKVWMIHQHLGQHRDPHELSNIVEGDDD